MPSGYLKKLKKRTVTMFLMGAITLPVVTGGIGWRGGQLAQKSNDEVVG
jgi:hypothetical protein